MAMTEREYESLAAAIAILTADVTDPDRDEDFARRTLLDYRVDHDLSSDELLAGAMTLASVLLVKLEKEGHHPSAVLQDVARRYRPAGAGE